MPCPPDVEPLTADAALAELLDRVAAAPGAAVLVASDELALWPADAVAAFKCGRVLLPAGPDAVATCPGCEQSCRMPVVLRVRAGDVAEVFIACDKRDDIGRVPVPHGALERWRCSTETLADALACLLGTAGAAKLGGDAPGWRLGVVAGQHGRAAVVLRPGLTLDVAGHSLDLRALLRIHDGALALDASALRRCADNPVGSAGAAESPEQRRQRLKARVAALKAAGVKAFLKVLAGEENLSPTRLKQLLAEDKPAAASWATPLMAPVATAPSGSKNAKRQR